MTLTQLLELLANNAHHQVVIENALQYQSDDIRRAFLQNDSKVLKAQFNDPAVIIANRSSIVSVSKE